MSLRTNNGAFVIFLSLRISSISKWALFEQCSRYFANERQMTKEWLTATLKWRFRDVIRYSNLHTSHYAKRNADRTVTGPMSRIKPTGNPFSRKQGRQRNQQLANERDLFVLLEIHQFTKGLSVCLHSNCAKTPEKGNLVLSENRQRRCTRAAAQHRQTVLVCGTRMLALHISFTVQILIILPAFVLSLLGRETIVPAEFNSEKFRSEKIVRCDFRGGCNGTDDALGIAFIAATLTWASQRRTPWATESRKTTEQAFSTIYRYRGRFS